MASLFSRPQCVNSRSMVWHRMFVVGSKLDFMKGQVQMTSWMLRVHTIVTSTVCEIIMTTWWRTRKCADLITCWETRNKAQWLWWRADLISVVSEDSKCCQNNERIRNFLTFINVLWNNNQGMWFCPITIVWLVCYLLYITKVSINIILYNQVAHITAKYMTIGT